MLQDIRALQAEVLAFRVKLKEIEDVQVQNISTIARRIEKEVKSLSNADDDHIRASTNTPDLIRMWRLARSVPALYGLATTFHGSSRKKPDSVVVDVVYRKGHAWILRTSLKYRSLVTELTNLPIAMTMDVDSGKQDEEDLISLDEEDDDELFSTSSLAQLKIVETAKKLLDCAGNNLKIGAAPQCTLYFPRILEECQSQEDLNNVQLLFNFLQRMNISCTTEIGPPLPFEFNVGIQLKDDFGNEELHLSTNEPVHLDLTTLFVLCSDISNVMLSELAQSHQSLAFQMQEEATVPCLRDRIFPIIRGNRPLFCTPVAQHRFFEIVSELGSVYEKERARIMFSTQPSELSCHQLSQISIHSWPSDIRFPLTVQKFDPVAYQPTVPFTIEFKTAIAQDCFENCWYGRVVTLSANQQAVKTFREALFQWPDEVHPRPVVHLHAARSLTMYDRTALNM